MSTVNRIAYYQNRRDEVPNQELAKELADKRDKRGVREIAQNLWHENANVRSDCLKVLYELGYLNPALIAPYVDDFLKLIQDRNNRLVWGGMIALSTIADLKADEIYAHYDDLLRVLEHGSIITIDNGVKTLAIVAAKSDVYRKRIFPYLSQHLATCRPKDVPQHAEKSVVAVNATNKAEFIRTLEQRLPDLKGTQLTRVNKVIKEAAAR